MPKRTDYCVVLLGWTFYLISVIWRVLTILFPGIYCMTKVRMLGMAAYNGVSYISGAESFSQTPSVHFSDVCYCADRTEGMEKRPSCVSFSTIKQKHVLH